MRQILLLIITITLFGASPAYAGSVFKCVGADGEMTFSFTPCAPVEAPAPQEIEPVEKGPSKTETLSRLDSDIQSVVREIEETKSSYKASLERAKGEKTDSLTAAFDQTTARLLAQLNELQLERSRVARR